MSKLSVAELITTETINCVECGATAEVRCVCSDKTWIMDLPEGWCVADSYPPGDDGLYFVCGLACIAKREGRRAD